MVLVLDQALNIWRAEVLSAARRERGTDALVSEHSLCSFNGAHERLALALGKLIQPRRQERLQAGRDDAEQRVCLLHREPVVKLVQEGRHSALALAAIFVNWMHEPLLVGAAKGEREGLQKPLGPLAAHE
jgi:hypothetical protein